MLSTCRLESATRLSATVSPLASCSGESHLGDGHRVGEGPASRSTHRRSRRCLRARLSGNGGQYVKPPLRRRPPRSASDALDAIRPRVDVTWLGVLALTKRILIVLSEFGYWGEELVGPLETFDEAGYKVDFATPKGKRARRRSPPSMDPQYIDPPLGKSVTSQEVADKVKALDASRPLRQADQHLRPGSRSGRTGARRHFLRDMEAYYKRARRGREGARRQVRRDPARRRQRPDRRPRQQRARPRPDPRLLRSRQADRRGVLRRRLPRLRPRLRRPREHHLGQARHRPLQGVRLQGRHRLHRRHDFNMGPPPYPLEYILRDATAPDGAYHRQLRPRDLGHRRLPVHHRPLDAGLVPHRREDGRGARDRA